MAAGSDQTLIPSGVVLTGASSQIGVFAIPRLLKAGFRVIAVSRNGKPQGYPEFDQVEWLKMAEALQASSGFEYLLSVGPLSLAQQFLQQSKALRTAVVFSSSSVDTKQESENSAEKSQIQQMLTLESELQLEAEKQETKLVIFRPTLIYGCGLDTNISRLAQWVNRFGVIPVNGKANGLRQPVHADDLACAAVTALGNKESLPNVMPITGGETLSYSEMVVRIFSAMGKEPRLVRLPQWLFTALVWLAGRLRIIKGTNTEMVKRQKIDLIFDNQQVKEHLNYKPRDFTPSQKDFSLPEIE